MFRHLNCNAAQAEATAIIQNIRCHNMYQIVVIHLIQLGYSVNHSQHVTDELVERTRNAPSTPITPRHASITEMVTYRRAQIL